VPVGGYRLGHDPIICALGQLGTVLWLLGYPDQALAFTRRAVAQADGVTHPASAATGYVLTTFAKILRRESADVVELGRRATALAAEQGLPWWEATLSIKLGWALVHEGHATKGLAVMEDGFAAYRRSGPQTAALDQCMLLVDAYLYCGDLPAAARMLGEAFDALVRFEQRHLEAELHRLKGELLLKEIGHDGLLVESAHIAAAEQCFRAALDVARQQGAKSFELRAATGLARLWRAQQARPTRTPCWHRCTRGLPKASIRGICARRVRC
jgi:predicted ATPase